MSPQPPPPPQRPLAPTTTAQQDLTTEGQRRVNLIWEYTQSSVAILVVAANIAVWIVTSINGTKAQIPDGLSNALFLIVGFYFSRTNHQAIGGVGRKANEGQQYEGR